MCTITSRCAEAWAWRDQLAALPIDGDPVTMTRRAQIGRQWTAHAQAAGVVQRGGGVVAYPIWSATAFSDPRKEE